MAFTARIETKWWTLIAVSLVFLPLNIDFYGIVVALPTIGRELGASTTSLAWTVNAFILGMAGPLVAMGRLGDILGRRKIVLIGLALFGVASMVCGMAETEWQLIAGRAVQGVGAAMYFGLGLSIISNAFPLAERAFAIGIFGAVGGLGSAIGPLVGGAVTEALSWRSFFFVNVPFVLAGMALIAAKVPESRDETASGILDLPGGGLVTAGFVLLVLGLQQGQRLGFLALPVITSLVAGVLALVGFAAVERRSRAPLIDLGVFANADFVGATAVAFLANYAFGATMFFLTLYLQLILGYDPVKTGLFFIAFSIPFMLVGLGCGRIAHIAGVRPAMAGGMLVLAVSFLLLAAIGPASGFGFVLAGLIVSGIGQGLAFNLSTTAAMSSIAEEKAGAASGILTAIRIVGVAVGVAATGVLVRSLENDKATALVAAARGSLSPEVKADLGRLLSGSPEAAAALAKLTPVVAEHVKEIVRTSFDTGFTAGMLLCLAVSIFATAVAVLIKERPRVAHA
jgi:EmrB/QacA subfamily drug resistance transporter